MKMSYVVKCKGEIVHSEHDSFRDAIDQADMVHGIVWCGCDAQMTDMEAWKYAVKCQGFTGDYAEWSAQDDDERNAYELGAAGYASEQ